MSKLPLGAINKITGEYVYPKIANKKDGYCCPDCNKDLILCQGEIIHPYFRHKVDINPCHHYSNPTETQIHKDGKMVIKSLLERKITMSFIRNCCYCKEYEEFEIPEISETSIIQLEYRFEYNGVKIADVAYIENGDIFCIFEICNTHKTCSENRPEPWFEIDAETLIKMANDNSLTSLQIPCIRCEKCENCIEKEKNNIINKNKAIDILCNWFSTGIEIYPFKYSVPESNYELEFGGLEKNVKCDTGDIFDLILYEKEVTDDNCDRYKKFCIRVIYNNSYHFPNQAYYIHNNISVYYLDIDWILSQQNIPKEIKYITSLAHYDGVWKLCDECHNDCILWVKRIYDSYGNYKVIGIKCNSSNNKETEYIRCKRCESNSTPLYVMETNKINKYICKSCDIDLFSSGNIYISVRFSDKDEVKKLGAIWDITYKKWFINKNHKNVDVILKKWERIW